MLEVTCHLLQCQFINTTSTVFFCFKFTHGHPTAKVDKTSVFWDRPFLNKLVTKHKQTVTVKLVKKSE